MQIDNMCFGYQLAKLYDARKLQRFCERAICMNSKLIFESQSFLTAPYEVILQIISMNELLCDENDAINGCMAWAQAACRRNQLNSGDVQNLRNQLKEIVYQFRFLSIKINEFGALLHKYPDLFTKEESQEIIFVMSNIKERTKFNSKPRLFQVPSDDQHLLCCNRFSGLELNVTDEKHRIKLLEKTIFSSNRPVLLRGFTYLAAFGSQVRITINEKREERHLLPIFDNTKLVEYEVETMPHENTLVKAKFRKPIVIEPHVKYEIQLQLERATGYNRSLLMDKVSLDRGGIVIKFHPNEGETIAMRGVIHRLYFSIFDKWSAETANIFFRSSRWQRKKIICKAILMGIMNFFDFLNFLTSLII